jgi:hypothetical protein
MFGARDRKSEAGFSDAEDLWTRAVIGGREEVLLCTRLEWLRYRVVVPLQDKTLRSVVLGSDGAFREFDGVRG